MDTISRDIQAIGLTPNPVAVQIGMGKYAIDNETYDDVFVRVATALMKDYQDGKYLEPVLRAMRERKILPAGRILRGAGAEANITLVNCFVNADLEDSMAGIMEGVSNIAITMSMGGGIGTHWNLRPKGAEVKGKGTASSGNISFMGIGDATSMTVVSAGDRRGAQMATMRVDHPDFPEFITAKQTPGKLTQYNVSGLWTDAFVAAILEDKMWDLGHHVPPKDRSTIVEVLERDGKPWYVYRRMPARELYDMVMRATYDYAEPGVIFIDTVNNNNNLAYCETINASNPCGEQMLPANGACVLAMVPLPWFVSNPFTPDAEIDLAGIEQAAAMLVRVQNRVIDLTKYPLEAQRTESLNKRRIGIGNTGLANALAMLRLRYGSEEAIEMTRKIKRAMRDGAYRESVKMAEEEGPFPLFDKEKYLSRPFIKKLPKDIRDGIAKHGIRNGVLLSDAPTGTTSLFLGNISSGIEPTFCHAYYRKVTQPDGSKKEFAMYDPAYRLYCELNGIDWQDIDVAVKQLPPYMVTAGDLTVREHVLMQAACQEFVDSSISKTINVPEDYPFEEFKDVYLLAHKLGLKGCTTYRPSGIRGSVLSTTSESAQKKEEAKVETPACPAVTTNLPEVLPSRRIAVQWPTDEQKIYLQLSYFREADGRVRVVEAFFTNYDVGSAEQWQTLGILLTHVFKRDCDPLKALENLNKVVGPDFAFVRGKGYRSRIALIAATVRKAVEIITTTGANGGAVPEILDLYGPTPDTAPAVASIEAQPATAGVVKAKEQHTHLPGAKECPKCGEQSLVVKEGCQTCTSCDYSKCG